MWRRNSDKALDTNDENALEEHHQIENRSKTCEMTWDAIATEFLSLSVT